jgi:hypothetical protein
MRNRFKRVQSACIPCRKGKLGCDESRPCSKCRHRGIPEQCIDRRSVDGAETLNSKYPSPLKKYKSDPSEIKTILVDVYVPPPPDNNFLELIELTNDAPQRNNEVVENEQVGDSFQFFIEPPFELESHDDDENKMKISLRTRMNLPG